MSGERNSGYGWRIGACGARVVFGDIGTSPLYAMSACFTGPASPSRPKHVLGVLSLIFLVLGPRHPAQVRQRGIERRHQGEGGVLAPDCVGGEHRAGKSAPQSVWAARHFGRFAVFADGAITPAISVLSAVEGVHVAAPDAQIPILPITVVVLVGLFLIQPAWHGSVGKVFGPVMLGWFAILAVMGVSWIVREPGYFSHSIRRTHYGC